MCKSLFFRFCFLAFSIFTSIHYKHGVSSATDDFGNNVIALSWAPSDCTNNGKQDVIKCEDISKRGAGYIYCLHGIWLKDNSLCSDEQFTMDKIPTQAQPRINFAFCGNSSLMEHEWDRHGKCSGFNVAEFFRLSLQEYEKYKPSQQIISKIGKCIPFEELLETYDKNKVSSIRCTFIRQPGQTKKQASQMLKEIRLCTDPKGCKPETKINLGDCKTDRPICLAAPKGT